MKRLYLKTVAALMVRAHNTGIGYYGLGNGVTEDPVYTGIDHPDGGGRQRKPPPRPGNNFRKPMEQEFILRKEEETYQKRLYTLSVERAIKRMAMEYSFDKKISYEQALEKVKKFYQETE